MSTYQESRLVAKLGPPVRAADGELRFNCPFCAKAGKSPDRKHHLYVTFRIKGRKANGRLEGFGFMCQRCLARGSVPKLFRRLGLHYQAPVKNLREEVTTRLNHKSTAMTRPEPIGWPDDYRALTRRDRDEHVYLYALTRGLTDDDIAHYKLGCGIGRNNGRLIIPVLTADGNCDYWQARDTYDESVYRYIGPKGPYRRWVIFNYHAAKEHDTVVIVEGMITAMIAGRNAVGCLGKEISRQQMGQLIEGPWRHYYVCMDGEERELTLALCARLHRAGKTVTPVLLPHGEDAASLGHARFQHILRSSLPYDPLNAVRIRIRRS